MASKLLATRLILDTVFPPPADGPNSPDDGIILPPPVVLRIARSLGLGRDDLPDAAICAYALRLLGLSGEPLFQKLTGAGFRLQPPMEQAAAPGEQPVTGPPTPSESQLLAAEQQLADGAAADLGAIGDGGEGEAPFAQQDSMQPAKAATVGIRLLLLFQPPLLTEQHATRIALRMCDLGQWPMAEEYAEGMGSAAVQVAIIQYGVDRAMYRAAHKAAHRFGRQHEFPDLERLYRTHKITKLVAKGLVEMAAEACVQQPALQEILIRELLAHGQHHLAVEYHDKLGLHGHMALDLAQRQEGHAQSHAYLQVRRMRVCL